MQLQSPTWPQKGSPSMSKCLPKFKFFILDDRKIYEKNLWKTRLFLWKNLWKNLWKT
jgi:hypothetical protein